MGGQNNLIVMIFMTKQYTDENCKFIKFARIFTYERQFGKRKSMLFLTILSKKKIHSVGGKNIIYCWQFCWIYYSVEKKTFYCRFCVKKNYSEEKFYFREYEILFFFLNRTLSTGVRRVPNSTKVPKEEFKLPFSYLLCVNQRGFLISSSLVKYYIFYDFRQSLCRFN